MTRGRKAVRRRILVAAAVVLAFAVAAFALLAGQDEPKADPSDEAQVASGRALYLTHCAACHGRNLEGQPDWRQRLPSGRMPAPPHDDSGHTWHHPTAVLFGITKHGLVPPFAPPGYQSDMPGFGRALADEQILAVLAYIKSRWSPKVRATQAATDAQAERRRP